MNQKRVNVISRKNRWALKKAGTSRASKIYESKEEAVRDAMKFLAEGYDVFVHRQDGTVDIWKKAPSKLRNVA